MGDSFLSRIPTVEGQLEESNSELIARLEQAKIAYKEKFGKDLPITSKVRTREQQKDLYNRWKKGEKGIYMPLNPADYPNQKIFHTDAADISTEVPDAFLKEFGLHRPLGKNDPVHTVIDPSFKKAAVEKTTEIVPTTQDDFLSRIPSEEQLEKIKLSEPTESIEREYKPGYFNPNLVAQGERAREAGGGNLQPIVEGVTNALGGMSFEDWKKESLIANMLKYGAGSMPIIGDEQLKEEGRQKLLQTGEAAINALSNPRETLQAIGQQEPGELLGQMIKGGIYDAPLGLATKPITSAVSAVAKPVMSAAGKALTPVGEGFGSLQEAFQKLKPPTKAEVTLEGANYRPDLDTQMSGVGAANVTKENIFNHAIETVSPELANDLKLQFKNKDYHLLNENALNAHIEADSLPIPIRLTEGQATGDAALISEERNARRANPQTVARLNEQNKLLKDNAFLIKEQVAPDINTVNHVADANEIINSVNKIKESNKLATQTAYKELENANGGKLPIDSQLFAKNANEALSIGDDVEFLPPTIKNRLDAYSNGKEMNFNQFENLRTQIANESRKASRSGDGNAVHALSLVREELEKLPLTGETAELKPLADKARLSAKKDFKLERENPLYKDVVNDKADTKDLIQKHIFGSKNKEFAKNIELLSDNPEALKHLRSGTIDYITSSATDASGNFSTATFNKLIKNLDDNGKLDALFGTDAELIRKLGRTGQKIEARPKGSYVNESNTSVAQQVGEKAKSVVENAVNVATSKTGIPVGTVARNQFKRIKENKRINESLRPSAGTKLQNIGKE